MSSLAFVQLLLPLAAVATGTDFFMAGIAVLILLAGFMALRHLRGLRSAGREREKRRDFEMTRGSVTKLVKSYGSTWGRIKPQGGDREVFFNTASLDEAVEFSSLDVGQVVEFEEHADNVNGAHAEHVVTVDHGVEPQVGSS